VKDSPLEGASRAGDRTVWLDRENSEEARENYFQALCASDPNAASQRRTWDIAWAAAVAVHSYINEGRIAPR
jgi:hypothetical protein